MLGRQVHVVMKSLDERGGRVVGLSGSLGIGRHRRSTGGRLALGGH